MTDLPLLPLPPDPAATKRRYLLLGAVVVLVAALTGAGVWYYRVQQAHAAQMARTAEIAAARARVVAAARARGLSVTAKAVATTAAEATVAAAAVPKSARVADASRAGALFGAHSWYVAPPPPAYVPPPPPPPPPPPMAPPLPFVFLGSYTPGGDATVFFLTRGDRVYDVKVGDTLDGIYQVESATGGQLTFNYKPLNQRQALAIGATP
ncbi:MAG: secretion system X translation initiation factor [Proteobacteria bacterium]|nr:secretion system X translation initiation factor [Pseudomonadota bacterium]